MINDLAELLADFRDGQPVQPELELYGHIRSVAVVADVLASMLGVDRAAAMEMAEKQIRRLAVERLAAWQPTGRGH